MKTSFLTELRWRSPPKRVLANLRKILAIELLCASQGIDFLCPLQPGIGGKKAHGLVRSGSPTLTRDRSLAPDIRLLEEKIVRKEFAAIVRSLAGGE